MTIRDLHRLAYTRFPRGEVHGILHDQAELAFGVRSLTECTPQQLAELASFVRNHPARDARTHRPRSGRRREPGVVKLASTAQRDFIRALAGELGWSRSTLSNFLQTWFDVGSIEEIATSRMASDVINRLIGYRRSRQRRDRAHGGADARFAGA